MLIVNNADSTSNLLPLECTYLNKIALHSIVGQQPVLPKHFTLRRKPKSAALRAELIQKGRNHLKVIPTLSLSLPHNIHGCMKIIAIK